MMTFCVRRTRPALVLLSVLMAVGLACGFGKHAFAASTAAGTPEEDLAPANAVVQHALTEVRAGDLAAAKREFDELEGPWSAVEDRVKDKSPQAYEDIEKAMGAVEAAFAEQPQQADEVIKALTALDAVQKTFMNGGAPASGSSAVPQATLPDLMAALTQARTAAAAKDYAAAEEAVHRFQDAWLAVEGEVKTRSVDDYRQTENDMGLASALLAQKSPDAEQVLARMETRLAPYSGAVATRYTALDAALILLREGLEALLIIAALLTFLKKSNNSDKRIWVWAGVGAGALASVALGVVIQVAFSAAITPANRELIEGFTGLIAAAMLIYMSYWMHSKASTEAWAKYIRQRSAAALAAGSLSGIALLAFLSIFREGGETVLFFLGMASSISLNDLLTGLALGLGALVVLGTLIIVAGMRIPVPAFFSIASVVVFYLCFKFIGTGIHALQIARVLPTTSAAFLPESGFLGLFPSWEPFAAQLVLVAIAVGVLAYERMRRVEPRRTANA